MFKFSDGILSSAAANCLLLPRVLPIYPSNIAQWLAYASVALDVSPFAGQFVQATSLTVGYSLLLSVSKFESFGATDAWGIEKQGNITQDPKTAYILTTTVQLRSGCGRLGTMVAPGNSALKAMHNGEWHHHQLYLWDKKGMNDHEIWWAGIYSLRYGKYHVVLIQVVSLSICFYRWIHGFRVPHDFLADMFGFRQVVEVHEALTLYLEAMWSCHVMVQIFISQKLRKMSKNPVGFKSSYLTPSERTIKTILDKVRWPLQRWRLVLLAKLLLPVVSLRPYLQRKLW